MNSYEEWETYIREECEKDEKLKDWNVSVRKIEIDDCVHFTIVGSEKVTSFFANHVSFKVHLKKLPEGKGIVADTNLRETIQTNSFMSSKTLDKESEKAQSYNPIMEHVKSLITRIYSDLVKKDERFRLYTLYSSEGDVVQWV